MREWWDGPEAAEAVTVERKTTIGKFPPPRTHKKIIWRRK